MVKITTPKGYEIECNVEEAKELLNMWESDKSKTREETRIKTGLADFTKEDIQKKTYKKSKKKTRGKQFDSKIILKLIKNSTQPLSVKGVLNKLGKKATKKNKSTMCVMLYKLKKEKKIVMKNKKGGYNCYQKK